MNFNLQKETEKVRFVLEKKQISDIIASIAVNLDVSGSMEDMYRKGTVQEAVQQILPVALNFDDNGQLDVNPFSTWDIPKLGTANAENYADYVNRYIFTNPGVPKWGGTKFAPVLEHNLKTYGFYGMKKEEPKSIFGRIFGGTTTTVLGLKAESESGYPAVVYHITDGENDDQMQTRDLLARCEEAKSNIYFLFIGIGNERFDFIRSLAEDHGNAGFASVKDLTKVAGTDGMYDLLLPDELTNWLRKR